MTYTLLIGQKSYSSWSLRGWLPFAAFDIPVEVARTEIYGPRFHADVARFGGYRTVPVARTPAGGMLGDSLAIAWHLAEAFPDKALLPHDGPARAAALSAIAEMHSGFTALRAACPMNLRTGWDGFAPDDAVLADLARIETLWRAALDRSGGPFLHGAYTLADVFFAPVATRIATYNLPVSGTAQAYIRAHLDHLPFRRWRAMGLCEDVDLPHYALDLPRVPFPAAPTLPAETVAEGPSVNARCPFTSAAPAYFARIGGRVFGFENRACRDEVVIDAEAWPAFSAVYHS